MPHAIIEYSNNLSQHINCDDLVKSVHHTMIECGLFTTPDIKTRSYAAQVFAVGDLGQAGSFIHIEIAMLEGRTEDQKNHLADLMSDTIKLFLKIQVDQISIDIRDMTRSSYRKVVQTL